MSLHTLLKTEDPEISQDRGNAAQVVMLCILLCAVIFMLYFQVKDFEFITFDDPLYVVENKHVQSGLTIESIMWAFHLIQAGDKSYWHPLTWFSHMLDYQFFGLNAGMHHVSSVVYHALCSILLFISLWLFTRSTWKSLFVGLLFAVHPVNVDSVAWVAERKNLLSSCFWMLTVISYYYYVRKQNLARYLGVVAAFVLGLLAKPMLVTLPFVLLLLDFWPLNRMKAYGEDRDFLKAVFSRNTLALALEKLPLFVISIVTIMINAQAIRNIELLRTSKGFPMGLRLENAIVSYLLYIKKLIWPMDLTFYYPFPQSIPLWQVGASLTVIIVVTAAAFKLIRKYPYVLFGWLWYLGTILPVSGIMQGGLWPQIAERWAYIPYVGLFIIISWGMSDLAKRLTGKEVAACIAALAILVPLAAKTWVQTGFWKDNFALYNNAIQINNENYVAHLNLGAAFAKKKKFDDAIRHYRISLSINPYISNTYYSLGMAYYELKNSQGAMENLSKALELDPNFLPAHVKLGMIYVEQKKMDDAIRHFKTVVEIDPFDSDAHLQLGLALSAQGEHEEAVKEIRQAILHDPKNIGAHIELGKIFTSMGRLDEAEFEFNRALGMNPENAKSHYFLGLAKDANGKKESAIRHINEALKIDPKDASYHTAMGIVLAGMGRVDEAQAKYLDAIRLDPDNADAHYYLGSTLLMKGKTSEAIEHIREAIRVKPDNGNYRYGLGVVLSGTGKLDEAEKEFSEALRISPNSERVLKELGNIMIRKGNYDAAITYYNKVLAINPNQADVHNNLGTAFIHKGEIKKAIDHYQESLKVKPDYAEAQRNLNMARENQKKIEGTIAALLKDIKARPGDASAHIKLAEFYRQYGNYDQAIRHYQEAISIKKDNVRAMYGLVLAYSDAKDYKKAIDTLQGILKIKPSDPNVYYNIACLYSRQNKVDEAAHWLDQSIQNGFNNWDMLRKDPDLASLRNTGYMKKLLSSHAPAKGQKNM